MRAVRRVIWAVLALAGCGSPQVAPKLAACRVPSQLPVVELRQTDGSGARLTLRLEQLAANDPLVARPGFNVTLPANWRVASGSFVIEQSLGAPSTGERSAVAAVGAEGSASWADTRQGLEPAEVTVNVTLAFPPAETRVPKTPRLQGDGLAVGACAD